MALFRLKESQTGSIAGFCGSGLFCDRISAVLYKEYVWHFTSTDRTRQSRHCNQKKTQPRLRNFLFRRFLLHVSHSDVLAELLPWLRIVAGQLGVSICNTALTLQHIKTFDAWYSHKTAHENKFSTAYKIHWLSQRLLDRTDRLSRNVGSQPPNYAVSDPRRENLSTARRRKP